MIDGLVLLQTSESHTASIPSGSEFRPGGGNESVCAVAIYQVQCYRVASPSVCTSAGGGGGGA